MTNFPGADIIVSHARYFVDKIANRRFNIKEDKHIEESHQQYSEYLELERELKELDTMEKESNKSQTQVKDQVQTKQKVLKLTFKEKIALEELPKEIEKLESEIEEKNRCLADPKCYEEIGITQLANELAEIETIYEQKMEELFVIEEKAEVISNS